MAVAGSEVFYLRQQQIPGIVEEQHHPADPCDEGEPADRDPADAIVTVLCVPGNNRGRRSLLQVRVG